MLHEFLIANPDGSSQVPAEIGATAEKHGDEFFRKGFTVTNANHLLLVEDDVEMRELVAESLRGAGYEVEEASDGRDALAAIMRECPSLIVTDCNMPNMTGNELVEQLALDERLCLIPAIVVSALKQSPMPANVIAFLAKPFKMDKLKAAVRDGLASRLT
jgi:two-component system chemotaxis response regulator CheY